MSASTLLVIMTHGAADDACRLFLPFWERSGAAILFSSPYDDRSRLDDVLHLHTGRAMTRDRSSWWWYQARVLATMKTVVSLPFDGFLFSQYDSIALGALPSIDPNACVMHEFTNDDSAFKARRFHHPPWHYGRVVLARFLDASAHHDIVTAEHGIMDRWQSWVLEHAGIDVMPCSWSWSANSIDTPALVADCRAAIARGARFVHGCKNKHQLDAILEGQP